ncbi:MAG: hypothetical protein DHS20C12_01250 [Pseudohongiella sp.]|nr:MAG: hypothetical protein DHS20C12_01250 [Pseudohongiella sp.]
MSYPNLSSATRARIQCASLRPWLPKSKILTMVESVALLFEKRRPNAGQNFQSFTQALFERSTIESERHIAHAFRHPQSDMSSLLAKNRLHNLRFEQRRNTIAPAAKVRSYCEAFQIPQRDDYLNLVRNDSRSRIIASFHCGDFLYGSASLLSLDRGNARKYVLSLNRASSACHSNLATGFNNRAPDKQSELLLSESSSTELSQLLRAANTSILLFCDVPFGLNETTEVNFLNRRAHFSIGPALLALANRVPLLPLFNYSSADSNFVGLGSQIEPALLPAETLRSGAQRITQKLVSLFENVLLAHPEQWRFLSLLPSYYRA